MSSARLRLAGYVRVSRVAGRVGDAFISPEVQRETVLAYAKAHGHEVVDFTEDMDQSGGRLDRPGLRRVLDRIRSGEVDGIAVARLDRLSRAGVGDALKLLEEIQESGGQVVAVDLGLDPTTTTGELVMTVLLALARMERRRLSESWDVAKARAIERGAHVGPCPFGYQRRPDGTLEPDPAAAPIVTEAFGIAARDGLHATIEFLGERAPVRTWTGSTTRRFLGQRVYLGRVGYGETLSNDEAHAPLVDRATFERANARVATGERRAPRAEFPLSGVAVCGSCGGPMVGGRGGADARRTYRCARRCERPVVISAEPLEEHIDGELREAVSGLSFEVGRTSPDVAAALGAKQTAEHGLRVALEDVELRRILGDDRFRQHVAALVAADDRAAEVLADATSAERSTALRGDGALDLLERGRLGDILAGLGLRVRVMPGRGRRPVADRIAIAHADRDA